jgi:DnaK suppressor protein
MSNFFIADMRARLLKLREDLESLATTGDQSSQVVELDQTRMGRLSRMDAMRAQAMSQESGRRREMMLRKITAAIERIDKGNFGLCQTCEEPIHRKRLEFDATALLCIQCAQKAEE